MDYSEKRESIKEPTTPEETLALHEILRSDPQRYLRIVNEWLDENQQILAPISTATLPG